MAQEKGTAANAGDLLLKLETFLTTNPNLVRQGWQWQSMKDSIVEPYTTDYDMQSGGSYQLHRCFIGGGVDGQDRIVVPMHLYVQAQNTYYTLMSILTRDWDKTKLHSQQWVSTAEPWIRTGIHLWNAEMPYWFFANRRRFIIVVKVANRYMSMYCGFIMPSGTDREYSYPMYIGGNSPEYQRNYQYTHTGSSTSTGAPWKGSADYQKSQYRSCGNLINPQGNLVRFTCSDTTGLSTNSSEYNNVGITFPYHFKHYVGKTSDNQYVIAPVELIQITTAPQVLGWLDGIFYVSGFENSPENIITVNGDRYLCVPCMVQTGYNDYAAIKME